MFFVTASIGILSTLILYRIPVCSTQNVCEKSETKLPFWNHLAKPWKDSWNLLRERSNFAYFQIGFLLGGSALMLIQTTLPIYLVDTLRLSYTEILMAIAVCKAVGYAISAPFWVKWFNKMDIFYFTACVTLVAGIYPILLLFATTNIAWLYIAFVVFGLMQAGSELSWHMSGPIFSKERDSSIYTSVNVLMVGIRGCIAPLLGSVIYSMSNSIVVLLMSSMICLIAAERLRHFSKLESENLKPQKI